MSEENALVRRLPAVEALGAVDVVCTDKTGTLTKGQMTVSKLWVNDAVIDVDSADTDADVRADRTELLLRIGALCNDSTLGDDGGDPTELGAARGGRWPQIRRQPAPVRQSTDRRGTVLLRTQVDGDRPRRRRLRQRCAGGRSRELATGS